MVNSLESYRQMWREPLQAKGASGGRIGANQEVVMHEATLLTVGSRPVLRFERHLPGSVEMVWRAVTDPEEMGSWFPTRIEIGQWEEGAKLTHHFDDHDIEALPGTVLIWDPPHGSRFTWGDDTITFALADAGDGGTIFVLTEELSANHAARNAAGWDACLDRLEHGADRGTWKHRFDRYATLFEPVLGPQDGPPDGVQDLDGWPLRASRWSAAIERQEGAVCKSCPWEQNTGSAAWRTSATRSWPSPSRC